MTLIVNWTIIKSQILNVAKTINRKRYCKESMVINMTEKEFIENYDVTKYERPSVTVDTLIFSVNEDMKLEILLKQRDDFPFKDKWCIPGGFVGINESLDEAANRVLKEKTGAEDLFLEQLYTFGAVDRDPRMRVITVTYTAMVPKAKVKLQAENAIWFIIDDFDNCILKKSTSDKEIFLSGDDLGFDHSEIIQMAIKRIQGKLEYTDIAFELLNDKKRFAIYELQKIHEAIRGKELDTANFKRYVTNNYINSGRMVQTSEQCREFSKRPSWYYRLEE